MKKLRLLCGMLVILTASCVREHELGTSNSNGFTTETTEVYNMQADQSRIVRRQQFEEVRVATRTGSTADEAHPYLEVPDTSGIPEYNENQIWEAEAMVIKETTSGDNFQIGNHIKDLYVEKSNITIYVEDRNQDNPIGTIYILPGAKNVKLIGQYWNPTPTPNVCIKRRWTYKLWEPLDFGEKLDISSSESALYYYGSETLNINQVSTDDNAKDFIFESHGPVHFNKKAESGQSGTYIKSGNYWFGAEVIYEDLFIEGNSALNMTYKGCVYIHNFTLSGNTAFNMNVDYFMHLTNGFYLQNIGSGININLDNAVLVIDGETDNNAKNIFRKPEHKIYGKGNSAVFIQGSVSVHKEVANNMQVPSFITVNPTTDKLAVFGQRHDNVTEAPVIHVMTSNDQWQNAGKDTKFTDSGILINESDIDDNFVIDSRSESDCRADYTWGKQPSSQDEILPPAAHKYSATGLDFDGEYVYICWHSNLPGGEIQGSGDNQFNHDHGTSKDPNREGEDGYGGPSVDNDKDWGGIIDIVKINDYNPDRADLYIAGTVWNPEHKYNHVKFHDDKLYLASTSSNVGAALHVVPIIDSEDGVGKTFDSTEAYRVNLTGNSANCVEIVDGKYIATISGHSVGGLNWFELSDSSNQTKYTKNSNTNNYGGKFIYDDGTYIYALHNTDNATITAYDRNGNQVDEKTIKMALVPYDGKNTMVVKDNKVYVCCGRNGLYVFDWTSGEKIGQSKLSANCVDVDENGYIYVATGGGLAVFKSDMQNAETKEYTTIKYVAYTGKGFVYPNGWEQDNTMPDKTAKESSNFVRVRNGKVFIAYGMYGMRIYSVNELINSK